MANLLLAALDDVSETRRGHYQAAVDGADGIGELVDAAQAIFEEDLDAGHIVVLAEMIAGASATPGLATEVAARIGALAHLHDRRTARAVRGSPLPALVEPDVAAHAVVALYLGLEMLAHLDGDRSSALALFDRARLLAGLVQAFGVPMPATEGTTRARRVPSRTRRLHDNADRSGRASRGLDGRGRPPSRPMASMSSRARSAIQVQRSPVSSSARGGGVRTLTGHPERAVVGQRNRRAALGLRRRDRADGIVAGATTLYNTYWVRFPHERDDHERAVANLRTLFNAAHHAGIQRIVHVSITHPSISSPYGYFRGKAEAERALAEVGVPYAVLRPAILFGGDGVLLNNIAWLLRRLPVFAVGGTGAYRVRAIHIDDLAALAVAAGRERDDSVIDAVGPERPTFLELVHQLRMVVQSRSLIVRVPGVLMPVLAGALGLVVRERMPTGDEYRAMADGLADTVGPATVSVVLKRGGSRSTLIRSVVAMPTRSTGTSAGRGSAPDDQDESSRQSQVEPERQLRASLGPVQADEDEAHDRSHQIRVQEAVEEGHRAHPGQAEPDDQRESDVAERTKPPRVDEIQGEEDAEEDQTPDAGDQKAMPFIHDRGDGNAADDHRGAECIDERLGSSRRVRSQ